MTKELKPEKATGAGWTTRKVAALAAGVAVVAVGGTLVATRAGALGGPTAPASAAAPPVEVERPQVPAPFDAVRVGGPVDAVLTRFPPRGDVQACRTHLVGGEILRPKLPGEDESAPHASCPDLVSVAGLSVDEQAHLESIAVEIAENAPTEAFQALVLAVAQVRSALRTGAITEAELTAVAGDRVDSARGAALNVAAQLVDGSRQFLAPRNARRPLGATIAPGCTEFDRDRVRADVAGDYSLGQLDGDARVRLSPCVGAFTQNERTIKWRFLARVGGLAGVGLARASRPDKRLEPADRATFAVFETRSQLAPAVAVIGVKIANALAETEADSSRSFLLQSADRTAFRSATVWHRGGRVDRVSLTLASVKDVSLAMKALTATLGPGSQMDSITRWSLPDGSVGRLDRGAAWGFFLEGGLAPTAPVPRPVAAAPSTSGPAEAFTGAAPEIEVADPSVAAPGKSVAPPGQLAPTAAAAAPGSAASAAPAPTPTIDADWDRIDPPAPPPKSAAGTFDPGGL